MKTLKEYITESFSAKKYQFKVKIAGDFVQDTEDSVKSLLEKYGVDNFAKNSSTPIQALPLDFPKLRNTSVTIYDVTLNYPTTPFELHEYLCAGAKIPADNLVVRNPFEPTEEYQLPEDEKKKDALLNDPNYKELPKIKHSDYYGTKFNQTMLKELAKISKERAKSQGLKVPTEGPKSVPEYDEGNSRGPISGSK